MAFMLSWNTKGEFFAVWLKEFNSKMNHYHKKGKLYVAKGKLYGWNVMRVSILTAVFLLFYFIFLTFFLFF